MTTLTLETILDSELNNQPATKADLRNLGMHFESQFAMVDARFAQVNVRLTELDTKVTTLGSQIRLDLEAFEVRMEKSINRNLRQSTIVLIGFAVAAIGAMITAPFFQ